MPVSNFSTLTLADFIKGVSDTVIQDSVLLNELESAGRIKKNCGGNGYEFTLRVSNANIGGVVTDHNTGIGKMINTDKTAQARYRPYLWRLFQNSFEQARNEGAPDSSRIADQEEHDLNVIKQEASNRIDKHLNGDGSTLQTGDVAGATPPEGLESIVLASGTYFGLSRSTYTSLNSQLVTSVNPGSYDDGVNQNLLLKMDELWVACSGGKGVEGSIKPDVMTSKEEPDLIICTSTLFRTFRAGSLPQHQYTGDKVDPRKSLAYGTAALKWGVNTTANRMYFLRKNRLQVRVVGPQLVRLLDAIMTHSPLGKLHPIIAQLQMHSDDPRKLGKITTSGTGAG